MAVRPNFFVVGAAKAGTTSLWMYLKAHPEIFMPQDARHKEPAYYCNHYGIKSQEYYQGLFSGVTNEKAIGESSTAYLAAPESAQWIRSECPGARIIIMLRNPVERAYSLYCWMVSHGYEWVYPFEKALAVERQRKQSADFFSNNPENFYNYMYFHSGLYSEQVARYLELFPEGQVKVLLLDDLKGRPTETVRDVYTFLGVDETFSPDLRVYNRAELRPFSARLHFTMHSLRRRHRHTRIDTAASLVFDANLALFKLKWSTIKQETKNGLLAGYHADIEKTSRLIGRDLSAWLA